MNRCSAVIKILGIVLLLSIAPAGCKHRAVCSGVCVQDTSIAPGKPDAASIITNGVWHLAAFQRPGGEEETVAPEPPYTIQFGENGRIAGQAHCNRHMGKYELKPAGSITLTAGASTLMMCIGDSIADEFLKTLGTVTNYETRDEKLILSSGSGAKLTFNRQ